MQALFSLLAYSALCSTLIANPIEDFWFNGAEINRYELSQIRYGEAHTGHAEFIFVTEPFLTETQVKHEYGSGDATDVLKLNALRTFNTGIYSYRTMTSTFQPIDFERFPQALKSTTSVQDWCGQAFQQLNKTEEGWYGELRSYFQSEGDQNIEIEEAWLEDALWLRLRLAPESLPQGTIQLISGAVATRFAHQPIQSSAAEASLLRLKTKSVYTVTYLEMERSLRIVFDTDFPHIVREWYEVTTEGTTKAVLTHRLMHQNYWQENRPADASKRAKLGLAPVAH